METRKPRLKLARNDVLCLSVPGSVQIEGHLGGALERCRTNRVLAQSIERLVRPFRDRDEGGGGFRCEYWGKWFTSAALAHAYRPTDESRTVLNHAVEALLETQTEDGYIGTYDHERQLGTWDVWGRKYVLLGLLAHYDLTGDEETLAAAERHARQTIQCVRERGVNLAENGWPDWKGLPPSSILEPMALLYQRTEDPLYLEFAREIVANWEIPNSWSPSGLQLVSAALDGKPVARIGAPKAYEMMSCYEGLCELYRVTGDEAFLNASVAVADSILGTEIMVHGSGSNQECWCDGARLQTEILEQPAETCVTATWIKFCTQLLRLTGDPKWADAMEDALYNALLGAMTPNGEWWAYYQTLVGERIPSAFQQADMGLSCCVASGPRALLLTPRWAVMTSDQGPVVNLYAPGTATVSLPSGACLRLHQQTAYPKDGLVSLRLELDEPETFTLALRIPAWSRDTQLRVNDDTLTCGSGTYAKVTREWHSGDRVELTLDLRVRAIPAPSGAPELAVKRGPVLLALDSRLVETNWKAVWLDTAPDGTLDLEPVDDRPEDLWMAFRARFNVRPAHVFHHHQVTLTLCDYASAGNRWTADSLFRVWLPQPLFLARAFVRDTWRLAYYALDERPQIPGLQADAHDTAEFTDWQEENE
jgi:DUF1680 family protein